MPCPIPSRVALNRSPLVWVRLKPKMTPLALGSFTGVLSPEKYGRTMTPPDPTAASAASRVRIE
jgi:hypothetical protein